MNLANEFHPQPKPAKHEKKAPKAIKQVGKKGKQWVKDRTKLIKEAIIEGRIILKSNAPYGMCEDCKHHHFLDLDHRKKRSQGGTNDKSNIDWVCNVPPCMCHDRRDNQGDPLGKKL